MDYSLFLRMVFNSAMLITGRNLVNRKKQVKNKPKVPRKIPISVHEAVYITQEEGR
jgi:hypothetical protein